MAAIAKGRAEYNANRPPMSDETRRKHGVAHKGKPLSAEHRTKVSNSMKAKGMKRTAVQKAAISKKNLGRKRTPEQIARIVAGQQAHRFKVLAKKNRLF